MISLRYQYRAYLFLFFLGGLIFSTNSLAAPVAVAGDDQTKVSGQTIILNGNSSIDSNEVVGGDLLLEDLGYDPYVWTYLGSNGVDANFVTASETLTTTSGSTLDPGDSLIGSIAMFKAPTTNVDGLELTFNLTVTDAGGSHFDPVVITVNQIGATTVTKPTSKPVALQPTLISGDPGMLDGGGSTDSTDGSALTYSWSYEGSNGVDSTFLDNNETITLTSFSATSFGSTTLQPGSLVSGSRLSFQAPVTTVNGLVLTFKLTVEETISGVTASDTQSVQVTINKNTAPIADVGTTEPMVLEDLEVEQGKIIQLNGSNSSDPDGSTLTSKWRLLSSPSVSDPDVDTDSNIVISSDSSLITNVVLASGTPIGTYIFELAVTDTLEETTKSSLILQIVKATNKPPIVGDIKVHISGQAVSQPVPENTLVTLVPESIDDELSPDDLTYTWSFVSSSLSYTFNLADSQPEGATTTSSILTFTTPTLGDETAATLKFKVNVSDGTYLVEKSVIVSVSNTESSPIALITSNGTALNDGYSFLEGETIRLDASGSYDPDGSPIASYEWEQTTTLISAVLSDSTSAKPTLIAPIVQSGGSITLTYRVTVTDQSSLSSTNDVTLTVLDNQNSSTSFPSSSLIINADNTARTLIGVDTPSGGASLVELTPIHESLFTGDSSNKPTEIPLGLLRFQIKVKNPGDMTTLTLHFENSIPSHHVLWTYNERLRTWKKSDSNVVFSNSRKTATITLVDGGLGDEDGIVNGIILDPSGFAGTSSSDSSDTNDGPQEGDKTVGCTLNPNADFDPILPFLIIMSLLYIARRRRS